MSIEGIQGAQACQWARFRLSESLQFVTVPDPGRAAGGYPRARVPGKCNLLYLGKAAGGYPGKCNPQFKP
eukprot:3631240-Rhodomonas_salina.2